MRSKPARSASAAHSDEADHPFRGWRPPYRSEATPRLRLVEVVGLVSCSSCSPLLKYILAAAHPAAGPGGHPERRGLLDGTRIG